MSNKRLIANQFEEITWNWLTDSNSRENSSLHLVFNANSSLHTQVITMPFSITSHSVSGLAVQLTPS